MQRIYSNIFFSTDFLKTSYHNSTEERIVFQQMELEQPDTGTEKVYVNTFMVKRTKMISKWIIAPNVTTKTLRFLENHKKQHL